MQTPCIYASFGANIATFRTEKDIGSENPETTMVSGFFLTIFQGEIQKISFLENDLWRGLELNTWLLGADFAARFAGSAPFFYERYFLYSDGSLPIYFLNVLVKKERLSKPQSSAALATVYPSFKKHIAFMQR